MPSAITELVAFHEDVFDPKIHLNYTSPKKVYTLAELKLEPRKFSTPIAATEAFPFLSPEGISAYRRALFNKSTLDDCSTSPFPQTLIIRNAASRSKFLHDLWSHPDTIRIMSDAMKAPLTPVNRMEEGFVSLQTSSADIEDMKKEVSIEPRHERIPVPGDQGAPDEPSEKSILPWHLDSFPYACIVMLSNTDGMVGGETYIRRGDGKTQKVEGPKLGCAYIIQGWMLEHLAARAFGVKERIASVTSFRVDAPGHYDESFTTNVRAIDKAPELQKEWSEYRLELLKTEIERALDSIRAGSMSVGEFCEFGKTQTKYLQRTYRQVVPYELTEKVIRKFGGRTYYGLSELWKQARKHPAFKEMALKAMTEEGKYKDLWEYDGDLALSRLALKRGESLMGQSGYVRLDGQEVEYYTMGDELLLQGQKELFLEWADRWGFSELGSWQSV